MRKDYSLLNLMTVCAWLARRRNLLLLAALSFCWAADASVFNISIEDNIFVPDLLAIHVGDTVIWTQNGGDHDVVQDDGVFSSGDLIPFGLTYSYTFSAAGEFGYFCSQHGAARSGMFGIITVQPASTAEPPVTPANISPAAASVVDPTHVELVASAFISKNSASHAASQWLVHASPQGQTVLDSGEIAGAKTNLVLQPDALAYGAAYKWQVRYKDSSGAWSGYSTETSFMTAPPSVSIAVEGAAATIAWPANAAGYALQSSTSVTGSWALVDSPVVIQGARKTVSMERSSAAAFFRLVH